MRWAASRRWCASRTRCSWPCPLGLLAGGRGAHAASGARRGAARGGDGRGRGGGLRPPAPRLPRDQRRVRPLAAGHAQDDRTPARTSSRCCSIPATASSSGRPCCWWRSSRWPWSAVRRRDVVAGVLLLALLAAGLDQRLGRELDAGRRLRLAAVRGGDGGLRLGPGRGGGRAARPRGAGARAPRPLVGLRLVERVPHGPVRPPPHGPPAAGVAAGGRQPGDGGPAARRRGRPGSSSPTASGSCGRRDDLRRAPRARGLPGVPGSRRLRGLRRARRPRRDLRRYRAARGMRLRRTRTRCALDDRGDALRCPCCGERYPVVAGRRLHRPRAPRRRWAA